MIHIITYDLHNPGRDYDKVIAEIKKAQSWAHPQGSVWFIDTDDLPEAWRDRLREVGDANDEYFVGRMHESWATLNTDKAVTDWLKSSDRNW